MGPLGFARALQPLLKQLSTLVHSLRINAWYLDDGTISGDAASIAKALDFLEVEGPPRGLHVNRGKCFLFTPPGLDSSLPPDIPTSKEGFVLLGSPICPPSF